MNPRSFNSDTRSEYSNDDHFVSQIVRDMSTTLHSSGCSNDDIVYFLNDVDALIESDEGGVAWMWSKVSIACPPQQNYKSSQD